MSAICIHALRLATLSTIVDIGTLFVAIVFLFRFVCFFSLFIIREIKIFVNIFISE